MAECERKVHMANNDDGLPEKRQQALEIWCFNGKLALYAIHAQYKCIAPFAILSIHLCDATRHDETTRHYCNNDSVYILLHPTFVKIF